MQEQTMQVDILPTLGHHPEVARSRDPARSACLEAIFILLLALGLNLAGNRGTGLWDRDEPRYAVSVREMRARGDWIFPSFNGEPRYHKPILIYWLMGLATAVAGDNPFGARLVSGLAGTATAVGVWWLGRRLFGPRAGLLSGLMFATAPIVVAESKLATTDATLMLWLLGCQASLWVLSQRTSRVAAALFWILLSLAILTKGPIGPLMIVVSTLLAWWWGWPVPSRQRLQWRWGLSGLLLLTCPWFVAVSIASHGEFLRFAIGKQIVNRVASDMEAHGGFPGYYPIVSALVFYPWSTLVPAAIAGAWMRRKANPDLSFLLGWIVGPLILLECVQTKLIHYYLPAFPACALLSTWLVLSISAEEVNIRRQPLGRFGMAILVGVGLVLAAVLLAATALVPGNLRGPMGVMGMLLVVGTLAGMLKFHRSAAVRAVQSLALTWTLVLFVLVGWLVPACEPYRTSRIVGERLASLSMERRLEPVLLEYQEPGVIYALGHPAAETRDRDGFFAHLEGGRAVLTVLLSSEIDVMRSEFGLDVTPLEPVECYDLTKGKRHTLYLAQVSQGKEDSPSECRALTTAGGAPSKQSLIK
jgi:4-amino-4-deoxy-L-arabinose transferase-like glycosyltransferase